MDKHQAATPSYQAYIKTLVTRNPSLLDLLKFLSNPRPPGPGCHIAALDFRVGIGRPIVRSGIDIDCLPCELRYDTTKEHDQYTNHALQGRILIIEDLTKNAIEFLGSELDIDPLFFAMHLHTLHRTGMRHQTPVEATLPSRLLPQEYINIYYHRPVTCDAIAPFGGRLVRDTSIDRKLVFLRSTTVGLAQHCVSVIKVKRKEGNWIALILVDPPIGDTYFLDDHKGDECRRVRLRTQPFLGVYEDFLNPPVFKSGWTCLEQPTGGCMSHDIQQYWQRGIPACFDTEDPTLQSLAYYPLRIAAAEWVKYEAVMQFCIKSYEYQNNQLPGLDKFNMDLRELQGWRRRSIRSQQKLQSIIRKLRSWEIAHPASDQSLQYLIGDYEVISENIENASRRLENTLPVVMSLVQISEARLSFAETANISRLTVLALVFVPLTYIASLFSMNPENVPGSERFWVYFAVAVPVTLLVIFIARPPISVSRKFLAWIQNKTKRGSALTTIEHQV